MILTNVGSVLGGELKGSTEWRQEPRQEVLGRMSEQARLVSTC